MGAGWKWPAELFAPDAFDFKRHHAVLLCCLHFNPEITLFLSWWHHGAHEPGQ
ncbi:MAG: hypothetical protein RI993_1792 [Pseudomonadota bacterium]